MKWRFETLFKTYVIVLVALLFWSVWATAQTADTNAIAAAAAAAAQAAVTETNSVYLTFGLNRVPQLQREVAGVPLWQYIASLIYIFLAFIVARLMDWLLGTQLRRWAERTKTHLDDVILTLLRGPVKIIAFVILLHIGLRVFDWPEWVTRFFTKGLHIIVAFSLTYVALKIVDVLMTYWKQRTVVKPEDKIFDDQLLPIIRNSLKVFIVIVAVLLTSQNLGLNITSLIASLSIGGLALGLAAQDTLANLFGAVAVFADKPFRVGERIRVDAFEGNVESIGMRSTRIRTPDGHLVSIPNKTVGNAVIVNITKRPNIRNVMNISVTYDTSVPKIQRALAILDDLVKSDPMTADFIITFNRFADSALNIEVVHFWKTTDFREFLKLHQALNLRIKEAFDREGIDFAFPTQTIHLKDPSLRTLNAA